MLEAIYLFCTGYSNGIFSNGNSYLGSNTTNDNSC